MNHAQRFRYAIAGLGLSLGLGFAMPATAQQRAYLIWLDPGKIDVAKIIGLPPAQNSPENKAEFDRVLQISSTRTPEREKAAIADQYQTLNRFLDGIDQSYVDATHREMRLLFKEAQVEASIVLLSVRRLTNRQRPFTVWNKVRIKPCPGGRPEGTSFPSGHAATAALYAELLSEAVPELAAKFEERVKSYDESRLVCGFHYPSDLTAGDKAGRAIAKALLAERAFRTRFDETRPEIRKAFGLS
ncbi:phosphatase PAP2 family protein [Bosea psychrotolerans]|uniref:Acid phosphatase n=1 Tax=Bosea psychrotolerans TaxID=1871628 RepID=A0A2S4MH98_9HYPH|nr:phosphatase PAP2 family protein [Bosea psychrotolerans]POR54126.1 acid phosphatase/acid phosphatase (class A) [Bosea psychrotolerans]